MSFKNLIFEIVFYYLIEIDVKLTSIFGLFNKSSTISEFPVSTARYNGVL